MSSTIHKLSLKWAIFTSFTFGLLLILGALYFLVPKQVEMYLVSRIQQRGEATLRDLKRRISLKGREFDEAASRLMTEVKEGDKDIYSIILLGPDGQIVAKTFGGDVKEAQAVIDEFNQARHPVTRDLSNGHRLMATEVFPPSGQGVGYILLELGRESVDPVLAGLRRTVLVALGAGCAVFFIMVWLVSRIFILRPLKEMMRVASRLSEADLTGRVETTRSDELGQLEGALNRIGGGLRETLGRVRGVAEEVAQVSEQISRAGNEVSSGTSTVLSRVEETSLSMAAGLALLHETGAKAETLNQSAQASSASIARMVQANDEVAGHVRAMAASVEETTAAIEEMTGSTKQVAQNIENHLASIGETSRSMREMDVSISQVEMNATATAKLSEQVSSDAERSVEALQKTLSAIDKIKESSRTASDVIESLGKRISEIGNILNVIDDVADQTNLLALNAAIIAAQAGEHGKGFAVVADEIKDLAERTAASTKEISELIRGVQAESRNAVAVMNQGVRTVEEGVRLGSEAEEALKKIFESANQSTAMVKAIAAATVEQAKGSKLVTSSIHRIAQAVQQISGSTRSQAKGSDQIMKSAERMRVLTNQVHTMSQMQAQGSKQIIESIERMNELVSHLNHAQTERTRGSEQVLKAVEAIKTVAEQQVKSVQQLEKAIETLQQQAEVLRAEVRRFKV